MSSVPEVDSLRNKVAEVMRELAERDQELSDLRNVMEAIPDILFTLNLQGNLVRWNQAVERVTGYSAKELLNKPALELFPPSEHAPTASAIQRTFQDGYAEVENHLLTKDGRTIPYHWTGARLHDPQGRVIGLAGMGRDITERRKTEQLLAAEKQLLALMASARPLTETLSYLCEWCESLNHGMLVSVLLLSQDGQHLRHGAAPSLPESYTRAIDGMAIGPRAGSCGTATYLRQQVIVGDIATNPLWEEFRELAMNHSLQACWSDPIISDEGHVLGTFAIYYRTPREPVPADLDLMHRMTNFARLAIERKRADELVREMSLALTQAMPGISRIRSDGRYKEVNGSYAAMLGYEPAELVDRSWEPTVHPEDLHLAHAAYEQMLREGKGEFEGRAVRKDGSTFFKHVLMVKRKGSEDELFGHLCLMRDISEQTEAEQALRTSEERLRQAMLASNTGLWEWNTETNQMTFSREWKSQLGFSEGELPDRFDTWETRLHPEDRLRATTYTENYRLYPEGEYRQEFRLRHKDGTYRWIEARASFVTEADGRRVRLLGTHVDITTRKQAEQVSNRITRRYKDLVDSINGVVWEADAATAQFTFVSPQVEAMLGYSVEQWLSSPTFWVDHMHPDDRSWAPRYCHDETMKHCGHTFEYRMLAADGRIVWVRDIVSVMVEDGRPTKLRGILEDITDRKQAEEVTRRLVTIVESSEDAIISKTLDSIVTSWNHGAERLFGYQMEEMIGQPITKLFPPDRLDEEDQILAQLKQGQSVEHFETVRLTKDGQLRHVSLSISPMRDKQGTIVGISKIARDITDRKRAEAEICTLNADLEQRVLDRTRQLEMANKELEAFSYSVSHDLRAPLRSIDGFSQALLEDCIDRLNEQEQDYLNRIRAATQRLGHLIDDLLGLSRATRAELRREPVDLSALARGRADEIRKGWPDRQVELVVMPGLHASADRWLLQIVLDNLLDNAWKFTSKREQATIEVGAMPQNGATVYFVRDNGVGFDMAYAGKLFGAFQRLHTMTEYPGTGIGLATVQRIVHRHGGLVWAEGAVGRGATFHFTLGERT